jgi:hypothetical protein
VAGVGLLRTIFRHRDGLREVVVGLASAPRVALAIAAREHGVIRRSRTTTTRMRWYAGGAEADIKVETQTAEADPSGPNHLSQHRARIRNLHQLSDPSMPARRESAQHPVSQSAAGDPFTIGTDEHRVRSLPATGWATNWHTDWPGSTR